ncbi:MAG: tetratricopeptide repeat protein [Thermomicrobiales bacterium]
MSSETPVDPAHVAARAETAQDAGDWDGSIAILRAALPEHPTSVVLLSRLGHALRLAGRIDEAVDALQQAGVLAPDDPDVLYELGIGLRQQASIWRAMATHERFREHLPDDPRGELALANDLTVLGRPDKALPELEALRQSAPDDVAYAVSHARALNRMGRYTEALSILDDVLTRDPEVVDAYTAAAEANLGLDRTAAWIDAATKAFDIDPASPMSHFWMHKVRLEENRVTDAAEHLDRALTTHRRYVEAQVALASLFWRLGELDEAEEWFASAALIASWDGQAIGMQAQFQASTGRGEPDFTQLEHDALAMPFGRLPFYLGRIYLSVTHDYDRAVRFLKTASDHGAEHVHTRRLLADAYVMNDQYAAASAEFQRVLDLAPHIVEAWIGLAFANLQAGRFPEAARAYAAAVARDSHDVNARHGYGVALLELGRTAEAVTELQKAADLAPQNGEALLALARALEAAGRRSDARDTGHQAADLLPPDHQGAADLLARLAAAGQLPNRQGQGIG